MRRGPLVALGALAALAALAFVLQPLVTPPAEAPARGPGEAPTVRALDPRGDIPRSPTRFTWSRDPAATSYRFELMGRHEQVLHRATTSDTALDVPFGIVDWNIVAGATWRVIPVVGATEGIPSDLVSFRIVSP